jgi:NAD(P)-dependent dehydrogenase (short-subunit alcohol dehydrogenase family)
LEENFAGLFEYRQLDISRQSDWASLAEDLGRRNISVDGLVNNAGIPYRPRLLQVDLPGWERTLAVSLTGVLLGIRTGLNYQLFRVPDNNAEPTAQMGARVAGQPVPAKQPSR